MIWVSSAVPGFQEALKYRAEQRYCSEHRLVLCRERKQQQLFFPSGFTSLSLSHFFPFHTLLATVFFEGRKQQSGLSWEERNPVAWRTKSDVLKKRTKVHIIYTVNIFSFKEVNYKESLSSFWLKTTTSEEYIKKKNTHSCFSAPHPTALPPPSPLLLPSTWNKMATDCAA